jgi:hypothetical protein
MKDAQGAYEAYYSHTRGLTKEGTQLPAWNEMSREDIEAWQAVAKHFETRYRGAPPVGLPKIANPDKVHTADTEEVLTREGLEQLLKIAPENACICEVLRKLDNSRHLRACPRGKPLSSWDALHPTSNAVPDPQAQKSIEGVPSDLVRSFTPQSNMSPEDRKALVQSVENEEIARKKVEHAAAAKAAQSPPPWMQAHPETQGRLAPEANQRPSHDETPPPKGDWRDAERKEIMLGNAPAQHQGQHAPDVQRNPTGEVRGETSHVASTPSAQNPSQGQMPANNPKVADAPKAPTTQVPTNRPPKGGR